MIIGIIGLGVVGTACKTGFESQGHTVQVHDTKLNTQLSDLIDSEIIYICVPTNTTNTGDCDISLVDNIIHELKLHGFNGVIAIKSTIIPGTTQQLIDKYKLRICFVPEFLKERCATDDFVNNHYLLAVGTADPGVFSIVAESHGNLPKNVVQLSVIESEILKYYNNTFNALRVVFANNMFELCQKLGADYNRIKDSFLLRETATDDYMNCSENLRGYAGKCLPKDTRALIKLFDTLGLAESLFTSIDRDNNLYNSTVLPGMRKE